MNLSRPLVGVVLAVAMAAGTQADAQPYPTSNIKIVAAFPPGGGVDLFARTLGSKLQEALGKPVVVENRAGAAGQIGVQAVMRAPADGHTLLASSNSPVVIQPHLKRLEYDPLTVLTPVAVVAWAMLGIAVNPQSPIQNLQDLIAAAKNTSGGIAFSNPGVGTQMHLAGELLNSITGSKLMSIPYGGTSLATAAVVSGEVQVAIADLTPLIGQAEAGRVRMLAIANSRRSLAFPDIPTVAESGVSGYAADAFMALFAPARTPSAIIERLNAEVRRALQMPDVRERFLKAGLEPAILSAKESRELVVSESRKWGGVVKSANIKVAE